MNSKQIAEALRLHRLWLAGEPGGQRLVWQEEDLAGANLAGANLKWADLAGTNFSGANLRGADFTDADLRGADLTRGIP